MSGVDDMFRSRQQNQRGAGNRKPPPRHPRDKQAAPGGAEETTVGGTVAQDVKPGPEKPAEDTQPQGGGDQAQQPVDTGEKPAETALVEPKPKPTPKPAAKKPPASSAKRADQDVPDQGRVLGGAVVALRGEPERKAVETAALEWAAAARKLAEKAEKLKTTVDAATVAGTPSELIVAALVQAEGRSGYKVPDQVRSIAEGEQKAR